MVRTTTKEYAALSQYAIAVAVVNYEDGQLFDWACYIDAVKGDNHENEMEAVARSGCKQSTKLATLLFPHIPIENYRQ